MTPVFGLCRDSLNKTVPAFLRNTSGERILAKHKSVYCVQLTRPSPCPHPCPNPAEPAISEFRLAGSPVPRMPSPTCPAFRWDIKPSSTTWRPTPAGRSRCAPGSPRFYPARTQTCLHRPGPGYRHSTATAR